MLKGLLIKNVALIDSAELKFTDGLNILSGETGSGKSIVLDCVNFVLGAKADKSMIRYGEKECMVKAEFSVPDDSPVLKELEELDIEPENTIIISRRYSVDGKGGIRINGNSVTLSMLKNITSSLVDVHGQSEHFYLLKESNQLKVLDGLCPKIFEEKKKNLSLLLEKLSEIKKALSVFSGDVRERNKRIDILKFQIDEIEAAELKDGEEEELRESREKILNVEKIADNLSGAGDCFSMENGVLDLLQTAKRSVNAIASLSKEYSSLSDRIENLLSEAEDIGETISDMRDECSFDSEEAEEVENRLALIKSLKGKYGYNIKEIKSYLDAAKKEYDMLLNCDEEYERLEKEKKNLLSRIYTECTDLSKIRRAAADEFSLGVVNELASLNIPKATFKVDFKDFSQSDTERANADGLDSICFMFSANAGEPLKPLGKIISGGEMSRFMLSIKTRLKGINGISTYIFDEIDTGISGRTAKVVAEKIATIAKDTQVIAVSHLAQMVAMSDNHLLIEKKEFDSKTKTQIRELGEKEKLKELVRLLGGEDESQFALKHAEEMLDAAKKFKNSL